MRVETSAVLPATQTALWDVLRRWEEQPRWMRDADDVRVIGERRDGTGTRVAVRTRVWGVSAFTEPLEVTEWDPPRRLALAHRGFVRGSGSWALEPEGAGTRLRWTEDLALPIPVLGEAALLLYRPILRRLMRGSLADLRAYVLAGGGSIPSQAGESGAPG
jgi:hypothetical protein